MSEEREEINPKTFYMIDNENIRQIKIRIVGLLDVFGKIEIDIIFNDNSIKRLVGIGPVNTNQIEEWLKTNNLYEKAIMYEF